MLLYHSTNLKAPPVPFGQALLKGLAPDKGLYMPETIPAFSENELDAFRNMTYPDIAFQVGKKYLLDQISEEDLLWVVRDAYDYPVPWILFMKENTYSGSTGALPHPLRILPQE